MITKITVRNFKQFDEVEIELGDSVVFIGPNNSGKTTALQALVLCEAGIKKWLEKREGKSTPDKRPGVTINRRDLVAIPVPSTRMLWRGLHFKRQTDNIRIETVIKGISQGVEWQCGMEFDYANEESFYCRPLRMDAKGDSRMEIPKQASEVRVAMLPPMSGLAANEIRLDKGAVDVRIGEGRTAEVLRNLCYMIYQEKHELWDKLISDIKFLFGCSLEAPDYIEARGEIRLAYRENEAVLDLVCSGRGLQQTLLLLAYMYVNPGCILLLDEPDAHLEILRQRQVYEMLTRVAQENGNQIIAASHSEVLLNEAVERDVVIAFVGRPHRINDRGSQVLKALRDIGFEDYYLSEQKGAVLYLEGSTDLAILQAFARTLGHRAARVLEQPFVKYVGNQPMKAVEHFHGLREAWGKLRGFALFDKLEQQLPATHSDLSLTMWNKKEIENYLCSEDVLIAYAIDDAKGELEGTLFENSEVQKHEKCMKDAIGQISKSLSDIRGVSPWDDDTKVSDDFFEPLFKKYYDKLKLPNVMQKKNYHVLAKFVPREKIDHEVIEKLDLIVDLFDNPNE